MLVILAVLAAIVVPKFTSRSEQARTTSARTSASSIDNALDAFEVDNSRFPTTDEGLNALVSNPGGLATWKGPYLKNLQKDPWGNDFVYRYPGQKNPSTPDVYSLGPDGREGNDDIYTNVDDAKK